ncbi:MAG: ribosome biogenesis protein [Nitrososphaerales archaeon]
MSTRKKLLHLIIGEGALEVIPTKLLKETSIIKNAKNRQKPAERMVLDRSYHHNAMLSLPNSEKRGRPDLVHLALLEATSTPLYMHGFLKVIVECRNGPSIYLGENVRLPRSYPRFLGLIEQLFLENSVSFKSKDLLTTGEGGLKSIATHLKPTKIIGVTALLPEAVKEVARLLSDQERPMLVVGGFPRGQFDKETAEKFDETISIGIDHLDAHLVIGRILYEYENLVMKE